MEENCILAMGAEDAWDKLQKNYKIGNFGGSSIWLKQALERENHFQKYLLSSCLLPTFS